MGGYFSGGNNGQDTLPRTFQGGRTLFGSYFTIALLVTLIIVSIVILCLVIKLLNDVKKLSNRIESSKSGNIYPPVNQANTLNTTGNTDTGNNAQIPKSQ
ncbi:MAG: hypothetical protein QME45_12215 [Clostridiales bacterium]|nr:hypothetical protein [Clostridiales bacterium]HBM81781.1 hypothetical protein [Clostridiaceae bacterium]